MRDRKRFSRLRSFRKKYLLKKVTNLRNKCLHNEYLILALFLWIVALLVELTARVYDLYRILPDVDIISHFAAGIAIGAFLFWLFVRHNLDKKYNVNLYIAIGSIVVSIVWEIIETVQEWFIYNPPYLRDIFFWDGFFDIIFALLGTFVFLVYINKKKNKINKKRC
jgi:hypothetical protein